MCYTMNGGLLTMNLLDFIFPKRCVNCAAFGAYFCAKCTKEAKCITNQICPLCQRQAICGKTHPGCVTKYTLDGLIIGFYYKGSVKRAIGKIKYRWQYDIANTLASLFSGEIWKFDFPADALLVPIPLHVRRKKWRGFNQAELICSILAAKFGIRYGNLLRRTIETKTQVGLSRLERKKNINGAFEVVKNSNLKDKSYILVDDVYTTGATMNEACKTLKRAGASEVWGLAIALG